MTLALLSVPKSVEKITGTPASGLFDESRTSAVTLTLPPFCPTAGGTTCSDTDPAAAAPIRTSTPPLLVLPEPVRAPPEYA